MSTNVTAYQMPYIHGLHCGYIISSSGGLNVAIFQLMEKLWWLKSGLFLSKVGGILIFQSGSTECDFICVACKADMSTFFNRRSRDFVLKGNAY